VAVIDFDSQLVVKQSEHTESGRGRV
jgi:hypothetical protein